MDAVVVVCMCVHVCLRVRVCVFVGHIYINCLMSRSLDNKSACIDHIYVDCLMDKSLDNGVE